MSAAILRANLSVDLEDTIRKEPEALRERLRRDELDDRAYVCDLLHQRAEALQWVLRAAASC